MWNSRLDEAQAGIKIVGEISIASDMQMTPPMTESEEENKEPLVTVKEANEKAGLKLNSQETKIMTAGPITLLQID